MGLDKLSPSELVIAGCGIALLVFSFLPWFALGAISHNAWDTTFSALGVLVGLAMVVQIVLARLTTASLPKLRITWGQVHFVLGLVAVVLIALQFAVGDRFTTPPAAPGAPRVSFEMNPQYGIILGLLAAAGLTYGGFRRRKEPDFGPDIAP